MKILKIIFIMLFAVTSLFANEGEKRVRIDVNGMYCQLCYLAVEKAVNKYEWAQFIDADIDTGVVIITLKDEPEDAEKLISQNIEGLGYEVVQFKETEDES